MKLEKIAAVAQIVSAAAIVVAVLYLPVLIQQNASDMQIAARQTMLTEERELLFQLIEFPELELRCNLTAEQDTKVRAYMIAFLRMRETLWRQYQSGVLDEASWSAYRAPLAGVLFDSEIGRALWHQNSGSFDPGFVESANVVMQQTSVIPCEQK